MTRTDWLDLLVVDLPSQSRFYQDLFGFEVLEQSATRVELGSHGKKRLGLQAGAQRVVDPRQSGLYHAAWLLPTRADLGAWLLETQRKGVRLSGASDHGVSEAIYLSDPEGNGIEVYWDKPRSEWPHVSGKLAMVTEALNIRSLAQASKGHRWEGFPVGAELGHLHFQSHEQERAAEFYEDLGFELSQVYPGARFYSLDGYHHDVAVNQWQARYLRDFSAAGLLSYGLQLESRGENRILDVQGTTCVLESLLCQK